MGRAFEYRKARKMKRWGHMARVFTKIGKEIEIAVKAGGSDPSSNTRLRILMQNAKAENMPKENVERAIKRATEKDASDYKEMVYEGYGVGGTAVIVECLTDNKNRTAGDVRATFSKFGGSLGSTGCVSYMFTKKGVIIVDGASTTEDELFELAIEAGADDVVAADDVFEVYTAPNDMGTVNEYLSAKVSVLSANIDMIPDNTVIPSPEHATNLIRLIDRLEENDDVQNVYHNAILPEEDEEE